MRAKGEEGWRQEREGEEVWTVTTGLEQVDNGGIVLER